jgi:hypothetical protein
VCSGFAAPIAILLVSAALTWPSSSQAGQLKNHSLSPVTKQPTTAPEAVGPPPAILKGTVTDAAGKPLAGALVRWKHDKRTETGSTGASGGFAFAVPVPCLCDRSGNGRSSKDFRVVASVRANLYELTTKNVTLTSGTTTFLNFSLLPRSSKEIGSIQGRVVEASTKNPIENAIVSVINSGDVLTTITNSTGEYYIRSVGYASDLGLRVVTPTPPCLAPTERTIRLSQPILEVNFSLPRVFTDQLRCVQTLDPIGSPVDFPIAKLSSDSSIKWQQADTLAIHNSNDSNADVWHSGHVNDILNLDSNGGMAVASDTGGVWEVTSRSQAIPLSSSWTSIDMTSLARGPDGPLHIYAGTWNSQESPGGYLYETDTSATVPLLNWGQVNTKPNCTSIQKILVVNRSIVLACDSGIWWSDIPPAPSVNGTYQWKQAIGAPPLDSNFLQGRFSGLALGPLTGNKQPSIVASAWGGTTRLTEIFWGTFSNGDLTFRSSNVPNLPGQLFTTFGRTSIASCPEDLTLMYAIAADSNDSTMAAVWKSNDGGQTWSSMPLPPNPGVQGGYNNVIAVAGDCHAVAIGWQSGPFISYDGANTWTLLSDSNGDLHGDIHALTFDPADPTTLYIGSDGGVASASGLVRGSNPTFVSTYNRQLFTMQLYHAAASSASVGIVSAALQDNGTLWAQLPGAWQHLTDCGCDGLLTAFINPDGLSPGDTIVLPAEAGAPYFDWDWVRSNNHNNPIFGYNQQQGIPIGTSHNTLSDGPPPAPVAVVRFPRFSNNAGQFMYSLTALNFAVYGAFANTDGSDLHWEFLGGVAANENVSALSSNTGNDVFVGTDKGNIYRFDPPYGLAGVKLAINPPDNRGDPKICALLEIFPAVAFASIATGGSACENWTSEHASGHGYVMEWLGQTWDAVSGSLPNNLPFTSLEAPDLSSVFAATMGTVYVTHNLGATWLTAADGLPIISGGTDLHYVAQPDGKQYLYLGTFGWSLWRTQLQ